MLKKKTVRVSVTAACAAILTVSLTPLSAGAQSLPLAHVLPDLILREIVVQAPTAGLSHVAHFSPLEANELNNPVVGIVQGFNTQMATQFSTFPLGSSTGGMTYVFDESFGTFRRASSSFGPLFAERALTIGRRKLSVGLNYKYTSYNTFEGEHLDDGSIKFYLRHQDCCTFRLIPIAPYFQFSQQGDGSRLTPPFEGDIVEASLSLKATTHTAAVFANYGMTDHWDVGLAVPFVRVNLDASVTARMVRLVTDPRSDPRFTPAEHQAALNTHTFQTNSPNATMTVKQFGSSSGLGDVVLRTKYHFLRREGGGLAAAADLRLPTGNENELLGTGGAQAKFFLVASSERGRLGQHVNIGYTAAQGNVAGTLGGLTAAPVPDELNYTAGLEFVVSPRLTVLGDMVGRTLRHSGRLKLASESFQYSTFPTNTPNLNPDTLVAAGILSFPTATATFKEFNPRPGNLRLLLGTGGVKFNPTENLLISASVLFPLTNAGLRSRLTTVIGFDYAF